MKRLIVILIPMSALAFTGSAGAVPGSSVFASPTGNIQCVYANQYGIGCKTVSNGRSAILHAYTGRVSFNGYVSVARPWAAPVIRYGQSVTYGGTFHVHSSVSGFDVWSSVTGCGFHIDRVSLYRFCD
jgi:hypothetical protein